jgi:hypothetical protein
VSTAVYKEKNRFPYRREETKANLTAKQYICFPTIIKIHVPIKIFKKKYQSSIKGKVTINEVKTSEYQNTNL